MALKILKYFDCFEFFLKFLTSEFLFLGVCTFHILNVLQRISSEILNSELKDLSGDIETIDLLLKLKLHANPVKISILLHPNTLFYIKTLPIKKKKKRKPLFFPKQSKERSTLILKFILKRIRKVKGNIFIAICLPSKADKNVTSLLVQQQIVTTYKL